MSNIEQVGARMVLQNGPQFRSAIAANTKALAAFNDEQERAATLSKSTSKVIADAAAASAAAVKAGATESTAAVDEAAKAQEAAQARYVSAQKKYNDAIAAESAAGAKKAVEASSKILKVASVGSAAVLYEGIKGYMSFQQMMSQGAIDAGLKSSQIPALSKIALQISSSTGIAAAGTNGIADAMYRLASAYPGLKLTNKELGSMTKNAANLGVLFGQTGNLDQISRMYGAIESTGNVLKLGGKKPTGSQINQWALSVVGHGDVKGGDLVSALGTGILAQAKTNGISLNSMGAAFDVLSPAMNASQAATLLSHSFSLIASPNGPSRTLYSMAGLNPLSVAGAISKGDLAGGLGTLDKFLHTPLTGSNYTSKTYGSGLSGVEAYLQTGLHYTASQIQQAVKGGFAAMSPAPGGAPDGGTAAALSMMFGGAKYGSTIQKLLLGYNSGVYGNKLSLVQGGENETTYQAALKVAYAQPMRKWDQFENKFKNMTITLGQDVTPAFDGFLGDLEKLGGWFSNNRWAIKALLGVGGTIVGGAALIKGASVVAGVARGGASIVKAVLNPGATLKSIFSGSNETQAAAIQLQAARMQLEAAGLKGGIPGVKGGVEDPKGGVLPTVASAASKVGVALVAAGLGANALNNVATNNGKHKPTGPLSKFYVPHHGFFGDAIWDINSVGNGALNFAASTVLGRPTHLNVGNDTWTVPAKGSSPNSLNSAVTQAMVFGTKVGTPMSSDLLTQVNGQRALLGVINKVLPAAHDSAAAKLADAADKQKAAAAHEATSATDIGNLIKQLLSAASNLNTASANAASAFSPSNIHAAAKAGRQAAIARK